MGVADIISVCGFSPPRWRSAVRCITPNRCCSSATARASPGIDTPSWISACVPMTRSSVPSEAIAVSMRLTGALTLPVSNPTETGRSNPWRWTENRFSFCTGLGKPSSIRDTERKCCSARTSVGAINAPWNPAAAADKSPARATTVLPLPTSPCRSRFIGGAPRLMSPATSSMQRDWALVRSKGSESRKFSTTPSGGSTDTPLTSTWDSRRAPDDGQLERQQLVEGQAGTCGVPRLLIVGKVGLGNSLAQGHHPRESLSSRHLRREGFVDTPEPVLQGIPGEPSQCPGCEAIGERVHRHQPPGMDAGLPVLDRFHSGGLEDRLAAEDVGPAANGHHAPRRNGAGHVALAEPNDTDVAGSRLPAPPLYPAGDPWAPGL